VLNMNKLRQQTTLKKLYELAQEREGHCLSTTFTDPAHKYLFRCQKGHEWMESMVNIQKGSWCPTCYKQAFDEKEIKKIQELAQERGGRLLSTKYIDSRHKLTWECKKGHTWEALTGTIRSGSWCPKCAGVQKLTIDDMHKVAKRYGGKCLSSTYVNKNTKLKWECKLGHQWMAMPGQLLYRNSWCPTCSYNAKRGPKFTLDDMKNLAASYNGKCLSDAYIASNKKMMWECERGHTWEATTNSVKKGKWCPDCLQLERNKRKLEQLQAIASEHGGRCLATEYVSGSIKMMWECAEGHTWETTPHLIRQGTWCVHCRRLGRPRNLTIVDMQKLAQKHNGICLSSTYLGMKTELKWMCSHRHAWFATPQSVQRGKWCPICKIQPLKVE